MKVVYTAPATPGAAKVTGTISDGRGGSAVVTWNGTIRQRNRPPTVTVTADATRIRSGSVVQLRTTATDPDGDAVSYAWHIDHGTLTAPTAAETNWTAPAMDGPVEAVCEVTDAAGLKTTGRLTLQVRSVNHAPTVTLDIGDGEPVAAGVSTLITATGQDADGDPLTYTWTLDTGTITGTGNKISFAPAAGRTTVTLTCRVNDDWGDETTIHHTFPVWATWALAVGEARKAALAGLWQKTLPTPTGNEEYGLVIGSPSSANTSFRFEVNGGGDLLINKIARNASSDMIADKRLKFYESLRLQEFEVAPLVREAGRNPITKNMIRSSLGDTASFYTDKWTTAVLMDQNEDCEIWLDASTYFEPVDPSQTISSLATFKTAFSQQVLPFITQNYGRVWERNGDGKTTILVTAYSNYNGANGFFRPKDMTDLATSDKRDMIYLMVNDSRYFSDKPSYEKDMVSTLVHEMQHLVNFCEHVHYQGGRPEEVWLNEGLSTQAQLRFDQTRLDTRFQNYASCPELENLTHWGSSLRDYGSTGLFVQYLHERCGDAAIKSLVTSTATGKANVDAVCAGVGGFSGLFWDWGLALMRYGRGLPADAAHDYQRNLGITLKVGEVFFEQGFRDLVYGTGLRFIRMRAPAMPAGTEVPAYTRLQVKDVDSGNLTMWVVRLK